jgi:UDP-N-acetylglucosamine 2-epimerase (non-hydrolysing)
MSTADAAPILIVAGTRPEVIKLAPVYFTARARFGNAAVQWISTGQHHTLEQETLRSFGIECTHRLNAGDASGSLITVNNRIIEHFSHLLRAEEPALVVVQGDTASAYAAAFAAFHARIPVAHVEAGLRTYDNLDPFPEEAYRRMIGVLATIHFAPTPRAAAHLRSEGCAEASIYITGNTAVDALALIDAVNARRGDLQTLPQVPPGKRLVFVTLHRRESWGTPLRDMCLAIRDIAERFFDDVHIVFPLHVNPQVQKQVRPLLSGIPHITIVPPLDYAACHALISQAYVILTDSGGIQEEAPSYGVPVLVLRRATERPEAVEQGTAVLTGTDRRRIFEEASRLLSNPARPKILRERRNPFGDGRAAQRIVTAIGRFLGGEAHLLSAEEQFGTSARRTAVS